MPPRTRATRLPDWDAIHRDYAAGEILVKTICATHAITPQRLYRKWEQEGWPLRQPSRSNRIPSSEAEMASRLVGALDRKTRLFEKHLRRNAASDSAADSERDARTLNMLVRLFEKLAALQGAAASRAAASQGRRSVPPDAAPSKDPHDQERLRGELARRLDTLRAQIGG